MPGNHLKAESSHREPTHLCDEASCRCHLQLLTAPSSVLLNMMEEEEEEEADEDAQASNL